MKKAIVLLFLIPFISYSQVLSSQTTSSNSSSSQYVWNLESGNLAVEGYDVVAYFSLNKNDNAVRGSSEFSYEWEAAVWQFSSQDNLEKFKSDPAKYIPQYGGYCSYAVARNYLYSIDPNAWTIKNNKLYLNANKSIRRNWLKNTDRDIERANQNWPSLKNK